MQYDAIIVGARLAGAGTALLLAQQGHSVLLLDQDRFPSTTLSTHLFFGDSMNVFDRIGVLDRVLAIDAPRLRRLRFPYVDAEFPEQSGRNFALCIRREPLDAILVEAAEQQPRIDVRTASRVTGLLREGKRVTGVSYRPVGGDTETHVRGRIVIGADGRNSRVAREVEAEQYDEVPSLFAWYYGYFRGVPVDDPPSAWAVRTSFPEVGADYGAAFVFPADDDLTLVGFGVQNDAFTEFKRNHRENFLTGIRSISEVAARLGGAELEGPVVGTGELPNFMRIPAGPGWALVGDAGCHKDPHTAQGIGDALRSAVLLTESLEDWWKGPADEDTAMEMYHLRRDADLRPMYDFTTSRLEATLDEEAWQRFTERTWEDPDLARRRVAAMTHAIPSGTVYSARAIQAFTRISPTVR